MTDWFTFNRIFTVTDSPGDIGLFLLNYLLVDTIAASRMALYCCLLAHFPADLYDFLIFSRHLCSYKSLLLNYWSITMVIICWFSRFYYNNSLILTHCCSNYSISIIKSITLSNALYLEHWTAWSDLSSLWKYIYTIFRMEVFSMMWLTLK